MKALDGGEWSASRLGRFTPKERAPGTHWIGGWVGPRAVLDAVVRLSWLQWWIFGFHNNKETKKGASFVRSLERHRRRWEERCGLDWIHLAQDRDQWRALVNMVMNLRIPCKLGNSSTSWVTVSFSGRTLICGVHWAINNKEILEELNNW
jgi:hypothetical protein